MKIEKIKPDKKASKAQLKDVSLEKVVAIKKKKVRAFFFRPRHFLAVLSFVIVVLGSSAVSFYYLYWIARDQFMSTVAFTVRSEEFRNPLDALGSLGNISSNSSIDTDVLYDFISSQKIVERVNKELDLDKVFSPPGFDPVFAYTPHQPIEALVEFWKRMVKISYESSTGLVRVEAYAFTPHDAYDIARLIVKESDVLVNELSQIALDDRTRYSRHALEIAEERLRKVRSDLNALRVQSRIIDPQIDLQSRMGVLTALQGKLADAIVREGVLRFSKNAGDPRLEQILWEIKSLRARIAQERDNILIPAGKGERGLVEVMGHSERLMLETELAQKNYVSAFAAYQTALAEGQRRSRYLATHIPPTLPESSVFPNRPILWGGVTGFALLFWIIGFLIVSAARDRR